MAGAAGARAIEATYHRPYQAHAAIAPSCALAESKDGKLTVWTHSQGVFPLRATIARALGLHDLRRLRAHRRQPPVSAQRRRRVQQHDPRPADRHVAAPVDERAVRLDRRECLVRRPVAVAAVPLAPWLVDLAALSPPCPSST